jgi:DNA topoisomerase-6 subunit B
VKIERVASEVPEIPAATLPHPHTMKLGEFMTHAGLYGKISLENFFRKGFSRVSDASIKEIAKKLPKGLMGKNMLTIKEDEFKKIYTAMHEVELIAPSTRSVLTVGEEGLSKSIQRLGEVDFFSVVTRKPTICDFKPVVVEVAIARFKDRSGGPDGQEQQIQLLRFANRVPLQFDKGACAITRAVETVNWRTYGLNQPKDSVPTGPFVFAISVTSPFIKFKNASKETIDGGDDLIEEIRRALMQAGQKLSRHIRAEGKAADLERKISHIEKFGPILVEGLARIVGAKKERVTKAEAGLQKLLGRDASSAKKEVEEAHTRLDALKTRERKKLGLEEDAEAKPEGASGESEAAVEAHEEAAADQASAELGTAAADKDTKKKTSTRKKK